MIDKTVANILAIESAIKGGSLALYSNGELRGSDAGAGAASRAEDLLVKIDELLRSTVGSARELTRIAVSVGPGSFTGLRIGIATAMGLARSLDISCTGVPVMKALAKLVSRSEVITAVPIGRDDICIQRFGSQESSPAVISPDRFRSMAEEATSATVVVHADLFELAKSAGFERVHDAGINMAIHVGRYAAETDDIGDLKPIYVQNPRFA